MLGLGVIDSTAKSAMLVKFDDDQGFIDAVESILEHPERLERMSGAAHRFALRSLDTTVIHGAWLDRVAALAR